MRQFDRLGGRLLRGAFALELSLWTLTLSCLIVSGSMCHSLGNRWAGDAITCRSLFGSLNFIGDCQCFVLGNDTIAGSSSSGGQTQVHLQCARTNARNLMSDIDNLMQHNVNLVELRVANSNLNHLYNLPSGLYNIQCLELDNTGIDLETLRESHELLKSLKCLRISNENFTEIPETLFNGMDELMELSLNNLGMGYINVDAFVPLQDSLKLLELRSNRIRMIPMAVQVLTNLECLDLSGNNIRSITDNHAMVLTGTLKRLKKLVMNRKFVFSPFRHSPLTLVSSPTALKCSCEFGRSKFATWLRTHAIKGVKCRVPNRLIEKDVSNTPLEEFCDSPSPSGAAHHQQQPHRSSWWCLVLCSVLCCWFTSFH